jgi:hypothetical protein
MFPLCVAAQLSSHTIQLPGSCGNFKKIIKKRKKISSKEQFEIRAKIDFGKRQEKKSKKKL